MTIQQQLALAEQFTFLWKGLLPQVGTPDADQLLFWVGKYPEELMVQAFNRTARKVRKMRDSRTPMTLDDAIRYASSVMTNETLGIHQFPDNKMEAMTV